MRPARQVLLGLACLLAIGVLAERWSRWRAPRAHPPIGEMVDIGGRSLHLN